MSLFTSSLPVRSLLALFLTASLMASTTSADGPKRYRPTSAHSTAERALFGSSFAEDSLFGSSSHLFGAPESNAANANTTPKKDHTSITSTVPVATKKKTFDSEKGPAFLPFGQAFIN